MEVEVSSAMPDLLTITFIQGFRPRDLLKLLVRKSSTNFEGLLAKREIYISMEEVQRVWVEEPKREPRALQDYWLDNPIA